MFPDYYSKALSHLIDGNLSAAQDILKEQHQVLKSEYSSQQQNLSWLKLLEARLTLQNNSLPEGLDSIISLKSLPQLLKAETYFVMGLEAFYQAKFQAGVDHFTLASAIFKELRFTQRHLLCEFNAYIGKANLDFNWDAEEQIVILNKIASCAYLIADHHILSLVYRQRSLIYKELGRTLASIEDGKKALELILVASNHSDAQAVYLNLCDAYLDLGETNQAQLQLERLIAPIDARHRFTIDYLRARMDPSITLCLDDYSYICAHYKERARIKGINMKSGLSEDMTSLERRVYVLLSASPKKKDDLISLLWPESANLKSLENRLYQLIFRFNRKSKLKVQKKMGLYMLGPQN